MRSPRKARTPSRSRHHAMRFQAPSRPMEPSGSTSRRVTVPSRRRYSSRTTRFARSAAANSAGMGASSSGSSRCTREASAVARVLIRHDGQQLAQRRARRMAERPAPKRAETDQERERLVDGEPHGAEGRGRVERVSARPPRLGPDRHTGLLQRGEVALDRAHRHLEALREPSRAPAPRRHRAQLLDERIEPIDRAAAAPAGVTAEPAAFTPTSRLRISSAGVPSPSLEARVRASASSRSSRASASPSKSASTRSAHAAAQRAITRRSGSLSVWIEVTHRFSRPIHPARHTRVFRSPRARLRRSGVRRVRAKRPRSDTHER